VITGLTYEQRKNIQRKCNALYKNDKDLSEASCNMEFGFERFEGEEFAAELYFYSEWKRESYGASFEEMMRGTFYLKENSRPINAFKILDYVLEELKVDVSKVDYDKIKSLKKTREDFNEDNYYGSHEIEITEYMRLSELIDTLNLMQ